MNDEDRFRAASRLLDDPLVKELFQAIEEEALNELLICRSDMDRVECITAIKTIRIATQPPHWCQGHLR